MPVPQRGPPGPPTRMPGGPIKDSPWGTNQPQLGRGGGGWGDADGGISGTGNSGPVNPWDGGAPGVGGSDKTRDLGGGLSAPGGGNGANDFWAKKPIRSSPSWEDGGVSSVGNGMPGLCSFKFLLFLDGGGGLKKIT